jgi:TonB-dependent SusC/RagA subfamily outer membrane receptor
MKKFFGIIVGLYVAVFFMNAADIEGRITDNGKPVKNLTVRLADADKEVVTNRKGIFNFRNVSSDQDTLIIGLDDDETLYIPLEGATLVDVQLKDDTVFVVKEKKETPPKPMYGGTLLTREMLEKTGETNLLKAIARRAAGVDYVNNNLLIRGAKSLQTLSPGMSAFEQDAMNRKEAPLYIVNGMEVRDVSYYTVMEVDSVEILKDTATSMYGAKGGNGVVIINLRK